MLKIAMGFGLLIGVMASAQVPGGVPGTVPETSKYTMIVPAVQPKVSAGQLVLIELESKFAQSVAEGGGRAFATWFAEDAVTLSNGKPAVRGRGAIAQSANWTPTEYALTWTPQGVEMGAANDMGFTWGHYEAKSMGRDGKPVVLKGRYITIWKKQADGAWKVAMDASAEEPAGDDCCTVSRP